MIAYISTFVVVFKFRLKKVKKKWNFFLKRLDILYYRQYNYIKKDDKDKKIKGDTKWKRI